MLAFFFAMRSCEYSDIKEGGDKENNRKTKLLYLRNLAFFKENTLISHSLPLLLEFSSNQNTQSLLIDNNTIFF